MITTVLAFLLTLGVLIVVHEYGHYRVAVACGVKVLRFSVGFGRVLLAPPGARPTAPSSSSPRCRWAATCACSTSAKARSPPHELRPRLQPQAALRSARRSSPPARLANLLLAVLLYAAAHWIGVDEPKARARRRRWPPAWPSAPACAPATGCAPGRSDGDEWHDVRSLTDLRWQVTQAVLHGEALRPAGQRCATAAASARVHAARSSTLGRRRRRRQADAAHRPRRAVQRAGAGRGQGRRRRRRGRACSAGDRVLRIDGVADRPTHRRLRERDPRQRHDDGAATPMQWHVERGGARAGTRRARRGRRSTSGNRVGRIDAVVGRPPEMVPVRYGADRGPGAGAVTQTWEMSVLTVKMLGNMLIGQASLKNLSGPVDDRRLRRPVGAPRPGLLPRLPGARQRQPGRAQPAAAADARWRTPDVLSFRGRDRPPGLRFVARLAAARRRRRSCC